MNIVRALGRRATQTPKAIKVTAIARREQIRFDGIGAISRLQTPGVYPQCVAKNYHLPTVHPSHYTHALHTPLSALIMSWEPVAIRESLSTL